VHDERAVTVANATAADRTHHVLRHLPCRLCTCSPLSNRCARAAPRNSAGYVATTARRTSLAYPRRVVRTGVRRRAGRYVDPLSGVSHNQDRLRRARGR
jgi:hypothetical protein